MKLKFRILFASVFFSIIALNAHALTKNASVVRISPASDSGKYLTLHQSNTLPRLGFNAGMTFDYGFEPLEFKDATGTRVSGIVDDLLMVNIQGAIGITDWWSAGINFPLALWEAFWDPTVAAAFVSRQNLSGKPGDLRLEMKFRILDIERYHVGLAAVPFIYFPTGNSTNFIGNGMWSPGIKMVFDADIKNRVFMTLNVGYRNYQKVRWDPGNTNAVQDDTLLLGGGINVRITDSWAVLGEVFSESVLSGMFKNQLQNPAEFLVGGRFTPQKLVRGLGVTVAGGRGLDNGLGCPDYRIFAGINYRRVYTPPPPPPTIVEASIEERIIITQKIHFEFGKSLIRPISYPILDDVAELLKRNTQILKVRVEGHTDWIGSDAGNLKLSQRRAEAVRSYLIQKGVEASRLEAVGYGETRPIADNNTVQGRARNRRTEFKVIAAVE